MRKNFLHKVRDVFQKNFPVKKICFLSKYSFEHVNYRFEDPAKSSSPNVLDYFASCPKKNGEYTLSKTIIISQNVPLDMWKVVLRTLPIDFCHTVEKTSAQKQNNHEIATILQKIFSQKLLLDW